MTYEVFGVDCSHWQAGLDWSAVAKVAQFAYIKATDGQTAVDDQFRLHWQDSKSVGIVRGAYHFYRARIATTSPIKQAESFASTLNGDFGELPPVLDVETNDEKLSIQMYVDHLLKFLHRFNELTGKDCWIYTSAGKWDQYVANKTNGYTDIPRDHPLWVANYGVTAPRIPQDWSHRFGPDEWIFWQTGTWHIAGHTVDRNVFDGTVKEFNTVFETSIKPVGVTPPPPPPPVSLPQAVRIVGLLDGEYLNVRDAIWGRVLTQVGNGSTLPVSEQKADTQGRLWYRAGSLWLASWYTEAI